MLHLHRSERADGLVDALRALLAAPLDDPFAAEVVAVPTRGMERWLTQRVSDRLGICANVDFPSPRRLTDEAVAAASGFDAEADPWLPERMVWPLLEVVGEALGEPFLRALSGHLRGESRRARRFAAVRHLAGLYDRYALQRPSLLLEWAAGGGAGEWQAELWRRLRARIGVPGPAERLEAACARLRSSPGVAALPPRISLFGLTRLPAAQLAVLRALAEAREVHLFLLHPSPALWEKVASAPPPASPRRRPDSTAANRLLASWGHDVRELQLVLGREGVVDHHHPTEQAEDTLLRRIQADVRADRRRTEPVPIPAGDHSIRIHACHGRARQVEVLRDAILGLLQEDPTLEPRDVIVMCPDIEAFAPLIQATFGAGEAAEDDDELGAVPEAHRPADLRVRLADRSLRQTNPMLAVAGRLIELAEQRLTASQVLDLADREPVRRRFGFDDEELARLEDWVAESGIRWGLDAEHRAPFKLAELPTGTWRAGLDRVLLGVTMTEDSRLFADVLPLDDVESGAIDLAGRFAELLDRLQAALGSLREPKPVAAWAAALGEAADALAVPSPRESWQRAELQRLLADVVEEASGSDVELELGEVRALLAERLQGRPTRTNFRTGSLTVCTLVPMRSVPHRVVCLLGLDDGEFPRRSPRDGDDVVLRDPHVGDRDARTEDRQLLLDALMAATERLIVTYTGNDERTNLRRPPAVPVGELLDVIDRTAGEGARSRVLVAHPLQPFDPRNFAPPRSFDRTMLDGAAAMADDRAEAPAFLPGRLPELEGEVVELEDLVRFVRHPVRAFLRGRLGVSVAEYDDEVEDALPVELDGLGRWNVGERILQARMAGAERRDAILAEIARGALPPGQLGLPVIHRVEPEVDAIVTAVQKLVTGEAGSVDVRVVLAGRTVSGTVPDVAAGVLRTVTYSRVNPRHRLAAWVRLLALTAAHPDRSFAAVTAGRGEDGICVARIEPLDAGEAREHLATLLALFTEGMREPLPLYTMTSAAWAQAARAGGDPERAARGAWESAYNFDKEDREPEHVLVLGGELTFEELLERGRLGDFAARMWEGLLAHERVGPA
jgi:exodeoxyribonuclease V gamma subunit